MARPGTARDVLAAEVGAVAASPLEEALPATCALLDRGWSELTPGHVPNWAGLAAVQARGRGLLR